MKKKTWKVHTISECEDCGERFDSYKNGQALAAKHAKHHKHMVRGEVGLLFYYDGRESAKEEL